MTQFGIKIDVDTERGTRIGVPNLLSLLQELKVPATFLFSLGPDNTGRAIRRVFRRGFLQKVSRTSVVSTYGFRTLLNGVLLPGPHIGKSHAAIMQKVKNAGFEVGIHAYDHQRWQDGVTRMSQEQIEVELAKARAEFERIFGCAAQTVGAPGWQANNKTLLACDKANLLYASDCRGVYPFFPQIADQIFNTLQIPTTLPTLDELIGNPQFPQEKLITHYLSLLNSQFPNIITIHAELEGMKYLDWFREFLLALQQQNVTFKTLQEIAEEYLQQKSHVHICQIEQGQIDGRSGLIALQKSRSLGNTSF